MPKSHNKSKTKSLTPAMKQYVDAQAQVPDALIMFRMGDFYEMFFEDALEAAPILEITLTSRDKGSKNPVPMCGIPHHALNTYVAKLLEAGKKVAICEQVEDPREAKGVVRREITRVVSPGVVLDPDTLDASTNNFLGAVVQGLDGIGFAYVDASTGDFNACRTDDFSQLRIELARVEPREIIYPEKSQGISQKLSGILPHASIHSAQDSYFEPSKARARLSQWAELEGVSAEVALAAGGLIGYLEGLQRSETLQVNQLEIYEVKNYLVMDETAVSDLELFRTLTDNRKKGSLLGAIDRTRTPMGARLLKRWLAYPLVDEDKINRRLDAVAELHKDSVQRRGLIDSLKALHDMERLATRAVTGTASPRELRSLAVSMEGLTPLREELAACQAPALIEISRELVQPPPPLSEAALHLDDDPPATIREGGIFKEGYNAELDKLRELARGGKQWLLEYEAKQRQDTGITSLKIRYNRVFGYYMEVTRPNLHLVPEHYLRKQTLVNAERFYTPELKEYEEKVLSAQDRSHLLEEELFVALMQEVAAHRGPILKAASAVARLDVFSSFAELAQDQDYTRPEVAMDDRIELSESRHPVVEQVLPTGRFVPNDILLDNEENQLLIITGPNMAGKSTIMRQVALVVILGQMGSFVPARNAHIGIADRIFTRVGATDSLARGLSTFMVEMTEAAEILKRATRRSLVILDEVGRGTSTYDGLSIAWSMTEYLHDFLRARTLFATHYHELTQLSQTRKRVKNVSVAVKEFNDEILFLHRLVEGATNRSYGVQVARLAGVPRPVIERSKEILASLEEGNGDIQIQRPRPDRKRRGVPPSRDLFSASRGQVETASPVDEGARQLRKRIEELSLDTFTPIEALNLLYSMKKELSEEGKKKPSTE